MLILSSFCPSTTFSSSSAFFRRTHRQGCGLQQAARMPVSPAASVVRPGWVPGLPGLAAHSLSRASGPMMGWVGSSWTLGCPVTCGHSQTLGALLLTVPRTLLARPLGLSRFGQFPGYAWYFPGYRLDCVERSLWIHERFGTHSPSNNRPAQPEGVNSKAHGPEWCLEHGFESDRIGFSLDSRTLSFIQQICIKHLPCAGHCARSW